MTYRLNFMTQKYKDPWDKDKNKILGTNVEEFSTFSKNYIIGNYTGENENLNNL